MSLEFFGCTLNERNMMIAMLVVARASDDQDQRDKCLALASAIYAVCEDDTDESKITAIADEAFEIYHSGPDGFAAWLKSVSEGDVDPAVVRILTAQACDVAPEAGHA